MKDRKITGGSQHRFVQGKSFLTLPVVFSSNLTGFTADGRAMEVAYPNFSEVCGTVSYNILIDKLSEQTN